MLKNQKIIFYRLALVIAILAVGSLGLFGKYEELGFLIGFAIMGYDVIFRGIRGILGGGFLDENFLMTISSLGAIYLGEIKEAILVMLLYQIGEMFSHLALEKSRRSVKEISSLRPTIARVKTPDGFKELKPSEVKIGETILVKPGERVPIDSIALGDGIFNKASLTGESEPEEARAGEQVLSGYINLQDAVLLKTTRSFEDSAVSKIVELSLEALDKKSKTEKFITRFARIYTPIVVLVAMGLAVIPSLIFGKEFAPWLEMAISFLAVSCPCALVISVPLSYFGGIGWASKNGILIKGGAYLEALAELKTVVTDKTGTLTNGFFSLNGVVCAKGVSEGELLETAYLGEINSNHPLAKSIKSAYGKNPTINKSIETKELSGMGIITKIGEDLILVGSKRLMAENGVAIPQIASPHSAVFVSKNGKYMGELIIADQLKADSKKTILGLKNEGIERVVALTGDTRAKAEEIKLELGLDEIYSELLPKDKLDLLEEIMAKSKGKTAFVGDGINDAPALSRADIGISMGALGQDVAIEASDVILTDDKPSSILRAIRIGKKTRKIVIENIVFTIGVKLSVLVLVVLGIAGLEHAVFADVGALILATLNALRILFGKEK